MNIKEIAELAGVSKATVSRYLNQGYVSEAKKEAIKKVIDDTGYIPSTQAQNLRTKKTKMIGVIIPRLSSESISKIVDGINRSLYESGYHLLLANTDNDHQKEVEYMNIFKNDQVDGIILIASIFTAKHKKLIAESEVPVVIVGQEYDGKCCVYHDDYNAAKALTGLLIHAGCKDIAHIGGYIKDISAGRKRRDGYVDALKEKHIKVRQELILQGFFDYETGYVKMRELLRMNINIDGVFCGTDRIASGAMKAIEECGLIVGKDISVVGIGDSQIAALMKPSLTTARYYYETSGVEAGNMMMALLKDETSSIKKIQLGYEIVERNSVKGKSNA